MRGICAGGIPNPHPVNDPKAAVEQWKAAARSGQPQLDPRPRPARRRRGIRRGNLPRRHDRHEGRLRRRRCCRQRLARLLPPVEHLLRTDLSPTGDLAHHLARPRGLDDNPRGVLVRPLSPTTRARQNLNTPIPALRVVRSAVRRAIPKHHARRQSSTVIPPRERRVAGLRLRRTARAMSRRGGGLNLWGCRVGGPRAPSRGDFFRPQITGEVARASGAAGASGMFKPPCPTCASCTASLSGEGRQAVGWTKSRRTGPDMPEKGPPQAAQEHMILRSAPPGSLREWRQDSQSPVKNAENGATSGFTAGASIRIRKVPVRDGRKPCKTHPG